MVLLPGCDCCGDGCIEHTVEDFCNLGVTANYYSYLEVTLYPPDGSNDPNDGWSVTFVDDDTNCTAQEYLDIFLRPDSGTDIYSKYTLPFIGPVLPPYDNPDYQLELDKYSVIDGNIGCGAIIASGVDFTLPPSDCTLSKAEGGKVDASEFCSRLLTGCNVAAVPTEPYREFGGTDSFSQQELNDLFSGQPVRLKASGTIGSKIQCIGCMFPNEDLFTYANLKGFVTVQMKCGETKTRSSTMHTTTKTTTGPGTQLKTMLGWFNIKAKEKGCGCKSWQKKMDGGGPQWCRDHKEEILAHLEKEAKKRGLPFVKLAASKLVDLAIRRAERGWF